MFGNRLLYYGGPGGIRRGLIWQSGGAAEPEWITPEQESVKGAADMSKFWGSFIFGGVQAIQRVTADTDPVTNAWTHMGESPILYYSKKKKVFRIACEWDGLPDTPADINGASDWFISYDWQPATGYTGTEPKRVVFNPTFSYSSLPVEYPYYTAYRFSSGTGWTLYRGSRIAWRGDPWDASVGYPFDRLAQTNSQNYNRYRTGYDIIGAGVTLWGISKSFELLDPSHPTQTHTYRMAQYMVINGDATASSAPVYFRGSWIITLLNAVLPEHVFTNLTN